MKTDAELVQLTLAGQVSAFETLVRRWSARVYGYTTARVRHSHAAEEIAQETFLKAFRSLNSLNEPAKFGAWILSIAHRQSLDWLKAKARSEVGFDDLQNANGTPVTPMDPKASLPGKVIEAEERKQQLKETIHGLPENLREVLMIYYFDKVTYQEIADMLTISVATVNSRLSQARSLLRERLTLLETQL